MTRESLFLALALVGLAAFLLWERRERARFFAGLQQTRAEVERVAAVVQALQDQVARNLERTLQLLQGQDQALAQRLTSVQGLVADLRERLGRVEEISRRVGAVAEDLAGLQDLLRGPKARGAFGEWVLSELLAEVLPRGRFQEQYRFRDGSVVDAAIFLEGGIVPVDAKFPIAGFEELRRAPTPEERQRLKKNLLRTAQRHVDTIAQKYIKPEEGTTDFALMYIPAEGVFLELLLPEGDLDFLAYAWNKRVFPCSPNSFYSYLRALSLGLKGWELARDVERVVRELQAAEQGLAQALEEFDTLGGHLRNAQRKWDEVARKFREVHVRLSQVAQKEAR
ncbi:MAG: DNA recombination protein RmuC [Candidatus Bipolaricaulota bacterium]|nr:DNA recombination protein RmuC [Candidatus Bipolaricaulota bacterium]MDW8152520.1 DNA recombination protein RmuC [Candidatus Bipolaricaulota bacterium]